MAPAAIAITALQHPDANGYSGPLSFLCLFATPPRVMASYRSGLRPRDIIDFGKTHGISIDKMVT